MLLFAVMGWNKSAPPLALSMLDPLLLGLIICWPIWRWVLLPLRGRVDRPAAESTLLIRAMNQSGEAVIITDRRGHIEYVNAAFCRIMDVDSEDLIGRSIVDFEPRMAGEEWRHDFLNCVVRRNESWREELREPRWGKSGKLMVTEYVTTPVRENGRITHFVTVKRDISVQRDLERQLQQAQKMEVVGTLAGGIAHNFNNMLAALSGNVYLIKQMSNPGVERGKIRDKLDAMEQVISRAAEHIQSLLSFARKSRVDARLIPLEPLIRETLKLARNVVTENIRIDLEMSGEDIFAHTDPTQLQQAVLNLLNNAVDALEGMDDPVIRVGVRSIRKDGETYACVSIADNGCGMPPHVMQKACDPYFTTKAPGKGTGLGLAMARGFVEQGRGFLDIRSGKGKGCDIRLCLPREKNGRGISGKRASVSVPAGSGKGKCILLADDEDVVRKTTAEALRCMGFTVLDAQNGRQALQLFLARRNEIHAVILDIVMPEMGGIKTARRMRETKATLPIVLMSGYDINGQANSALKEGICDSLIAKPVAPELLGRRLLALLEE